jgi:hypothetical protein
MKRWRIAQFHPEDRYEPDDEVADGIRCQIREIQSKIDTGGFGTTGMNLLHVTLKKLRVDLAERLYVK